MRDNRCIFVLGGARSGKSRFAQKLAESRGGEILFVATAEPLDRDMQERIEKHRRERPPSWRTIEAPTDLAARIKTELNKASVVLIDCLTLLISNLLLGQERGFSPDIEIKGEEAESRILPEIHALLSLIQNAPASFVIVSNDVGWGIVPENRLARIYRDTLGRANQLVAEHADEVYLMVAGIPLKVKG